MASYNKSLLISSIAAVGLAAHANASTLIITNADFEVGSNGNQDVAGWFDAASGAGGGFNNTAGDLIQGENANPVVPQDPDGSNWLNLVDRADFTGNPRGVYQSFGTHDAGVQSYDVSFNVGQKEESLFGDIIVDIYYGTGTGADGTAIADVAGLTLLSSQTISGGDYFAAGAKGTASETLSFNASGLADGEALWLSFKTDDDVDGEDQEQQALIDDVGVVGVVPEPGSLALLGLGGLSLFKRRRKG